MLPFQLHLRLQREILKIRREEAHHRFQAATETTSMRLAIDR